MGTWLQSINNWLRGALLSLVVMAIAMGWPNVGALPALALPRITAEQRLFLPLSLEFLSAYELPTQEFEQTRVGGLSALTYDRQRDRFYALSDDRSEFAPARFYTLQLQLTQADPERPKIQQIEIESVTLLRDETGQTFAQGTVDPEGMVLSPARSLWISSEGVTRENIPAFIKEFDLQTGQALRDLPIPEQYQPLREDGRQVRGIRDNLGFESLTINPGSYGSIGLEPFRLFVATEAALAQDLDATAGETRNRLLHYMIDAGQITTPLRRTPSALVVSEHLYPLASPPAQTIAHGLTELLALDQGGHFLGLERSFGGGEFTVRLFQLATGGANDIRDRPSLQGELRGVAPIRKQLLLDLRALGIRLDNLEGMTLGPQLPDGSPSLVLVSDDNFRSEQVTQFLLFRLKGLK